MSTVWVRADEAARGSLPARCARSGERCITRYPQRVRAVPAALEWAAWTDLWPLRRDAAPAAEPVVLPLLPSRHRAALVLRRLRDGSAALLPLALVGLAVGGGGAPTRAAAALAVAALLVHLAAAIVGVTATVGLRADVSGTWIRLDRVHPGFAEAVERTLTRPDEQPVLPEEAAAQARAAGRAPAAAPGQPRPGAADPVEP